MRSPVTSPHVTGADLDVGSGAGRRRLVLRTGGSRSRGRIGLQGDANTDARIAHRSPRWRCDPSHPVTTGTSGRSPPRTCPGTTPRPPPSSAARHRRPPPRRSCSRWMALYRSLPASWSRAVARRCAPVRAGRSPARPVPVPRRADHSAAGGPPLRWQAAASPRAADRWDPSRNA